MTNRTETVLSLVGLRAGGVGLALVLAPRWFRGVLTDFAKLADNELRVIGYVLLGTAVSVFAQRATSQLLSAKIDALAKEGRALPAT
jgi:uncharacterized protein YjeT (DUF2065 family)